MRDLEIRGAGNLLGPEQSGYMMSVGYDMYLKLLNDAVLEGFLCREPIYRRTPLGREICDVMLAVPRAFQRADYLPCILWGRTAQEASRCHTRDKIGITGRLQSRVYTKLTEEGAEERTAYEISALTAQIPMDLL